MRFLWAVVLGLLVCWFAGLLVCWFAGLLVLFAICPAFMVFLSLKYSFAASLYLSRHFLFLLLRVGLGLLILSPAQNLLTIDNLANLTEDWLKLTDSACICLANLHLNKYFRTFAVVWLSFGLRHEFALHS